MKKFTLHKVSDSTGGTVDIVARACLAQFPHSTAEEITWPMIRDREALKCVLEKIKQKPGFVIFTIVDDSLSEMLVHGCKEMKLPCIDLLSPVLSQLGNYLDTAQVARPGSQHVMDGDYFSKIDAIHFVLEHDDGKSVRDIEQADVILFGVSRTSKTPTCIYLANHGIKAANVQITPGIPTPPEAMNAERPLKIGLIKDPKSLVQVRQQRLEVNGQHGESDYADPDSVTEELELAREIFANNNWPVIDVSNKSVEETAATIIQMHRGRLDEI